MKKILIRCLMCSDVDPYHFDPDPDPQQGETIQAAKNDANEQYALKLSGIFYKSSLVLLDLAGYPIG